MKKVGVLISGRGTNLQALIDAAAAGTLGGTVAVVVSNVETAPGLDRARRAGIPAEVRDHRGRAREEHDADLAGLLRGHGVDLVCLAGYMRLLSPSFLRAFPERVLNVHPSLLPAFPGAHAVDDALAAGVVETGVTVHLVDEGLDTGPVVVQERVPILEGDTRETLLERLHAVEHRLLPTAVREWLR